MLSHTMMPLTTETCVYFVSFRQSPKCPEGLGDTRLWHYWVATLGYTRIVAYLSSWHMVIRYSERGVSLAHSDYNNSIGSSSHSRGITRSNFIYNIKDLIRQVMIYCVSIPCASYLHSESIPPIYTRMQQALFQCSTSFKFWPPAITNVDNEYLNVTYWWQPHLYHYVRSVVPQCHSRMKRIICQYTRKDLLLLIRRDSLTRCPEGS